MLHPHTETVDSYFGKNSNAQVSEQHEHCPTLQLSTPSCYLLLRQFSFKVILTGTVSYSQKVTGIHTCVPSSFFQRGPPATASLS